MTTVNDNKSWFGLLSPHRKLLFVFTLLFVVSWCFFLGFNSAGLAAEERHAEQRTQMATGSSFNPEEQQYTPVELHGLRTILIVGYDEREGYEVGRSDTMMLAFLNMDEKTVKLLSIPRDLYVQIPGMGKTKINHAFAYGGISLAKETVEYLLGITIDDYVMVDFIGFEQLVDAVDGVELYVDMDMINWNEGIEIYEGRHVLSGEEALGYVRYRGDNCSDYDRIKHQQYFMRTLMDKLLSFSSMTRIAELVGIFMSSVTTTLDATDALDLAQYAFSLDLSGMEVYTISGYPMYLQSGGYWLSHEIINQSELIKTLNSIAGDDFVFSPNVISDGGLGRYSIPDGEDEITDEGLQDLENNDGTGDADGDGSNGDGQSGDGQTGDGQSGDGQTTDPTQQPDNSGSGDGGDGSGDGSGDGTGSADGGTDSWDLPGPE